MIWKAVMKNGKEIYESLNGEEFSFKNLDFENVETFSIVDGDQVLVNLDLFSGSFSLNNLDLQKISELNGSESLELLYDMHTQNFKLSKNSLEVLNNLVLKNERSNNIYFDQTGMLYINNIPFCMGFEIEGEEEKFINQPPYNNIIHLKDAITDFTGNSSSANPYKRLDAITAYTIGYNKEHTFKHLKFNLSLSLKYEVLQKCVYLNCIITTNENVQGTLLVYYGNQCSKLEVSLYKNEPASLNRVITLM